MSQLGLPATALNTRNAAGTGKSTGSEAPEVLLTANVLGPFNVRSTADDKSASDRDGLQSLGDVLEYYKTCPVVSTEMVLLMAMRILSHFARDPAIGETAALSREGLIVGITSCAF